MVKRFILKKKLKQNVNAFVIKGYPEKVERILVIFNKFNPFVEQFTGKLEDYFKGHATVYKASLTGSRNQSGITPLIKPSISLKGHFKDKVFYTFLTTANLIIDVSQTDSLVKNYAISLAPQAYKISLNLDSNSQFQLTIKVDAHEIDQFFDEFVKYHKALKHG